MPANNYVSLYTIAPSSSVSSNNFTTLYNATTGNVEIANVPDRDFTTLYTQQSDINPTLPYGNANVVALLAAGTDGQNTIFNINDLGGLTVVGETNLGNVSNVHIEGGNLNFVLTTDGTGNLYWAQAPGAAESVPYIHFDVTTTGNNQQFTDILIASYANSYNMSLYKNGVNIEPMYFTKINQTTIQVNILLNSGDTIDVGPSSGGGGGSPGGNIGEVQYNGGTTLSGNVNFTFDQPTGLLTVPNISTNNITTGTFVSSVETTLPDVGNVHISGGNPGEVLTTSGTGNLYWQTITANTIATALYANVNSITITGGNGNGGVLFGFANNTINFGYGFDISYTGSPPLQVNLSLLEGRGYAGTIVAYSLAIDFQTGAEADAFLATPLTSFILNDYLTTNTKWAIQNISNRYKYIGNDTYVQIIYSAYQNLGPADFVPTYNWIIYGGAAYQYFLTPQFLNSNIANTHISGGANGYVLRTDGSGNLSWTTQGGSNTQITFNDSGNANGSPALTFNKTTTTLTTNNFVTTGQLNLGDIGNVHITGGTIGQFVTTDGSGNLSFITSTITPSGSNSQIQFNNNGAMYADSNLTYDLTNSTFNTSNIVVTNNINASNVTASFLIGDGYQISNIVGANITGVVANANYSVNSNTANTANISNFANTSNFANIVINSSQPNITSTGTLIGLTVAGTTSVQQAKEKTSNVAGSSGTVNFDVIDSAIKLTSSNATANFTLNIRGNGTTTFNSFANVNESVSITYINKNGATGYYANVIQIDGSNITPVWINNSPPVLGTLNGYDVYNFNILKTASSTYIVFGAKGSYK